MKVLESYTLLQRLTQKLHTENGPATIGNDVFDQRTPDKTEKLTDNEMP